MPQSVDMLEYVEDSNKYSITHQTYNVEMTSYECHIDVFLTSYACWVLGKSDFFNESNPRPDSLGGLLCVYHNTETVFFVFVILAFLCCVRTILCAGEITLYKSLSI